MTLITRIFSVQSINPWQSVIQTMEGGVCGLPDSITEKFTRAIAAQKFDWEAGRVIAVAGDGIEVQRGTEQEGDPLGSPVNDDDYPDPAAEYRRWPGRWPRLPRQTPAGSSPR